MVASLLAMSLMGAPAAVWPHPETCHVMVEHTGAFSLRRDYPVNLTNATAEGAPAEPLAMALPAEVIEVWNQDLGDAIDEALRDLALVPSVFQPDTVRVGAKAAHILNETRDRYFELKVEVSPDNGLGGHAAGNVLRFTLGSIYGSKDLVGVAETTVMAFSVDDARHALRGALVAGITEAFADFERRLYGNHAKPPAGRG